MEAERTLYNALRCLWKLMNLIHVLPQERDLSYFIIFLCSPNMLCRKKEWKYISGFRDSLVNMILLLLRDFINFDIANEDNIKKDNKIRDVQYSWKGIIVFQEMLFYRQESVYLLIFSLFYLSRFWPISLRTKGSQTHFTCILVWKSLITGPAVKTFEYVIELATCQLSQAMRN